MTGHTHRTMVLALLALLIAACGPGSDGSTADGGGGSMDAGQADAAGSDATDDDGDGFSELDGDCNDADENIHPDAGETCGDGIDNDCNGAIDEGEPDGDGDGFSTCQGDCDDDNMWVHPAADEIPADGIDNNCDGIIDADIDADGYTEADGDCNDFDEDINPGANERCFDGIDNDCDMAIDAAQPDGDGDGYGPCAGDCNDANQAINPGVAEIDGDGIDNNCDFLVDEDIDGDGWTELNGDCNDTNNTVYPGAIEICNDGVDNNCNGQTDSNDTVDFDGDGQGACQGDCDDTEPNSRGGFIEDLTDGADNDCNGLIDDAPACDCTATNEAQAMDICIPGVTVNYGGAAAGHGYRINQNYGAIGPNAGCAMAGLSTGPVWSTVPEIGTDNGSGAANPVSATGCFACTIANPNPWGHMLPNGCCENEVGNDVGYIHIQLQVPLNAQGFSFDFLFLSSEYPEWVQTIYNDTFYAIASTPALPSTQNISFDIFGQPLTINNGWFETPPAWSQSIVGTGYDAIDAASSPPYIGSASGWLTTTSPATPGQTLHIWFWIHDEGDGIYDSAVVLDNWRWELTPPAGPITLPQ